ncbi:hypothetical protein BT96DRAFT_303534 [Gymnopus androsaceus JB14]|uniref:Uncharacterized protein n=1 Tax=Gymnopus androsaceus JB14 TaxID=1447944 RepID=A0A6A4H1J0_9AGAR|nr:hypothetical protein BT96DRAFT_303534 [Gymnopus androsaceus JB14]
MLCPTCIFLERYNSGCHVGVVPTLGTPIPFDGMVSVILVVRSCPGVSSLTSVALTYCDTTLWPTIFITYISCFIFNTSFISL